MSALRMKADALRAEDNGNSLSPASRLVGVRVILRSFLQKACGSIEFDLHVDSVFQNTCASRRCELTHYERLGSAGDRCDVCLGR